MTNERDELLPLFVAEAKQRLARVESVVGRAIAEPAAVGEARREMHALKGASRMMGFKEVAGLCHRAEAILEDSDHLDMSELRAAIRLISDEVEGMAMPGSDQVPTSPTRTPTVQVPVATLDLLSDQAARARVLAIGSGGLLERLFELAALAERGVRERLPKQVLATLATSLRHVGLELEANQRRLTRLGERQLDELINLQVQPVNRFLRELARHAEELAESLGKQVVVEVEAHHGRLDRRIEVALRESCLHLVRNAVDHGIEMPDIRSAAGKNEAGRLRLEAVPIADRMRLVVTDDGRGIDVDAVEARAREQGIDVDPSDEDAMLQLLLRPGFTTRRQASEISGRGIGLDAVAATVREVGGDMWLRSRPGQGSEVTLELPVAHRGERVLIVTAGRHRLAVPAQLVRSFRRIERLDPGGIRARVLPSSGEAVMAWIPNRSFGEDDPRFPVLVQIHAAGRDHGLVVASIDGEEEVVIRPLPAACGFAGLYDGAAMLASGAAVPVLAVEALTTPPAHIAPAEDGERVERRPLKVLLVDDSAVTRAMVRRLLEDGGFEVTTASDGDRAWQRLETEAYDCVVTDIEMPAVDGLELTRRVRDSPQLADLPIILVSTRDRATDRIEGLEAGADAYLTKQSLDVRELVRLVRRTGGQ